MRVAGRVGRRPADGGAQDVRVALAHRRKVVEALPVADDRVDDAIPEAPELLGVERQRGSSSSAHEFMQ